MRPNKHVTLCLLFDNLCCMFQPIGQDGRRTSQGSGGQPQRVKATKTDDNRRMFTPTSVDKSGEKIAVSGALGGVPVHPISHQSHPLPTPTAVPQPSNKDNPYVSSKMYTSSFMSQEGSQNIQSLIGGEAPPTYPPAQYAQAASAVYPTPQQQVPYQQPPSVYQTPATYPQQPYQSYGQATTQVPYTQPMPEYDTAVPNTQYQPVTVSTSQYSQPGTVPATQYNQSGYAQQYAAPASGYPAQYQAAQPPSQTTQYQAAQPPSQTTQYPSYPPPMQPGSVNTAGYQALPPQMPTFSPVRTPQPPRPTNPQRPPLLPMHPTNPLRPTNAPPSNAPRPTLGQPLVRITGRPGW